MNLHKNARLTPQGREILVRRIRCFGERQAVLRIGKAHDAAAGHQGVHGKGG